MVRLPQTTDSAQARTGLILWAALFTIYLISRVYAATHIPIFFDEAMHVDWARATAESYPVPDPGFEGKWLSIKLFALASSLDVPFDDLIAARLSVVALSLTTALACYLIGRELFSPRAGTLGVSLYVVLPFSVLYTSLAMTDAVQMAFSSWAIFLAVRLARTHHWGYVVTLPLVLAAAILAKFSGFLLIGLPVAAVLLLTPRTQWVGGTLRTIPTLLTPLGLFALFYRCGMLEIINQKANTDPTAFGDKVWANLALVASWLWGLLTPSVAVAAVVAVGWLLLRERSRAGLFVVTLLGLAILPYVVISTYWQPRYILDVVIPVALAVGRLLDGAAAVVHQHWRGRRTLVAAVLPLFIIGVFSWPILRSSTVLLALPDADLPWREHSLFVTGWTSGYGVRELAAFLQEQSAATPGGITVARILWTDHPLQSLNIYLTPSPSLSLYTVADKNAASVRELARLSARRRTLLVLSTERGVPQYHGPHRRREDNLREAGAPLLGCSKTIWSYTRPGGITGFVVQELSCGGSPITR
jgi:hypothetical protein